MEFPPVWLDERDFGDIKVMISIQYEYALHLPYTGKFSRCDIFVVGDTKSFRGFLFSRLSCFCMNKITTIQYNFY